MSSKQKQLLMVGGVMLLVLILGIGVIFINYSRQLKQLETDIISVVESNDEQVDDTNLPNAYEGIENRQYDGIRMTDSLGNLVEGIYIVKSNFTPSERLELVDEGFVIYNYASVEDRFEQTGLDSDSAIIVVDSGQHVGVGYTDVKSLVKIRQDIRR